MKITAFLLITFFSIAAFGQKELYYPQIKFDSDTCCWRKLASEGKYQQGAELIVKYLREGKPENKHALKWHAGQLFAEGQSNKMAFRYFRKSANIFYRLFGGEEGKTWYFYVNGVKAFLKRDKQKLLKTITIWDRRFPKDSNYNQLVLLYKNWDKPYAEAVKD